MTMTEPPKGYKVITEGKVRTSDLVYSPYDANWGHPTKTDYDCLGSDVETYYGVARKTTTPSRRKH